LHPCYFDSVSIDRTFSIFAEESLFSPANLAECTPGSPPKEAISKPVSSAKTFNPEALWTNLALARAFPSIRGSSSGISSLILISEQAEESETCAQKRVYFSDFMFII
jgi:hypothetical protein